MKKRNMSIKAAVAILLGAASVASFGGVATGLTANMAAQAVINNTTALSTGSVAYSTAVPIPVGNFFVRVSLGNGAKFVATASTLLAGSAAQLVRGNNGPTSTVTVSDGTVSADQTFITYPVAITVGSAPVGMTLTYTAPAVGVTNAGFLATAGAVLPVSLSVGSTTAVPADIDSVASGNVITSVNGTTALVNQSGAANFALASGGSGSFIETKKIQVITGPGTALDAGTTSNTGASTTLVNFGAIRFTDTPGAVKADLSAFNLTNNYATTYGAVLTGNFSAVSAATGTGKIFLTSDAACAVAITGGTATVTATSATFGGVTVSASGASQFVCMQINVPNSVVIQPVTPSIVATLTPLAPATTSAFSTTATSLFALVNNGGVVRVRTYVPAASAGYTTFVRVINTGAVTATVSAAVIDQTTGVAGTSAPIATNLAPGAAVTLSSSQVESFIGAIAVTATRPTLLVTAPTSIDVQSFLLTNANGTFSLVSGKE